MVLTTGCAISFRGGTKLDPSLSWNLIKTGHFQVYFHEREEVQAKKAALIAEEIHALLVEKLKWPPPSEKTHLILLDSIDSPFGATIPIPHNTIYISLTPPPASPIPFLVGYDEWLREVIAHEYMHILHLDMNGGTSAVIRKIFGREPFPLLVFNGAFPNLLQPDWLIEGLATYEESAIGVSDRRDNAYIEMVLRMAVLENNFPTLDQAGGKDSWPGNQIQYLFGARFYDYLAKRFGEKVLIDLAREYSQKVVPFFVDSSARIILGQSYSSLWNQWREELTRNFQKKKISLETLGISNLTPITQRGDYNLGPRISPDGISLVYTSVNKDDYPSLHLKNLRSGSDRELAPRNLGFSSSWSRDGKKLAFAQLEIFRNYSEFNDLYLYDFQKRNLKRLTFGKRLRDPDFNPDGRSLVAVENQTGENRLVLFSLGSGLIEPVTWLDSNMIFSHPRWSPDGHSIVVSGWKNGLNGLYLVNLEIKEIIPLIQDRFMFLTPTWSPDGKKILFSSDKTGIYNIFSYNIETKEMSQITNLLGGGFTPEVSTDGREIILSAYHSRGFDLYKIKWAKENPQKFEKIFSDNISKSDSSTPLAGISFESYSPWPTLLPRFWIPIAGGDESGLQLGGTTAGSDILGRHRYDLSALYGFLSHRPAGSFQYENNSFYPTIHAGLSYMPIIYPDLLTDLQGHQLDYWENKVRAEFDISYSWNFLKSSNTLKGGYFTETFSALSTVPMGIQPPETGVIKSLRSSWQLNTSKEFAFSISPENGRHLQIQYDWLSHQIGSDFNQNRFIAGWYEYIHFFFPHHVLATRLTGAFATGDHLVYRSFQVGGPDFTEEIIEPDQTNFFLRGYPIRQLRGNKALIGSIEYRFPIYNIERGYRSWPFFLNRTHGALFFDIGNAWDRETALPDFRRGFGAEIKMDMTFSYLVPLRLRLGVGRGADSDGITQFYFMTGNSF
ncbi:MAG: PD40 domain-containing protein [Nitrospirae bacterium]|nr:PD40 domain-containing protein [Nitrospirota bacterium]MBI3352866.1 PD40 domain-containing protein [Nitrospirota bacterium]